MVQPNFSQQIRRNFLNYFKQQGHALIPSSSVVPHHDPTLLFINAGMNQFKDLFLGQGTRDYTRAATAQKSIRVGGKHNDLDNVGHTSRHLTFFEMLGNFSFGDYFKEKAIQYAWEVSTQVFELDADRIWITVFRDDDEAEALWRKFVPARRIFRLGEKDNFWAMGDTGPCGPCSELLFDRGSSYGNASNPSEDTTGERFLEFWNLVFMQYNRNLDGHLETLPKQSIDTGAGLERVVSLKMDVHSVFATDILRNLIAQIEQVSAVRYDGEKAPNAPSFHVIADHLRSLSFAIADGAQPSNVDRGYVLRKILRRAVRYGRILGFEGPFLAKILPRLVDTMGDDYHELKESQDRIAEILTLEEEGFFRTLKRGGNLLNQVISHSESYSKCISGEDAFKLKDTYGLPLEEITLIAKDHHLSVDLTRYQTLEQEAKERSRSAQKNTHQIASESAFADHLKKHGEELFLGYSQLDSQATITAIFIDGQEVESLSAGDKGLILLNQTPFYAEKGGQVGDRGLLHFGENEFEVTECQSPFPGVTAHLGTVKKGSFKIGSPVTASVNAGRRKEIANNHTATHLLHWALQKVLGDQIRQAGSVVDEERLRFDFSHHKGVTLEEIEAIEVLVNEKIRTNLPVTWYELPYEEAQKRKEIKQFFGDKYGSTVRVVDIESSKELCGGTHTSYLGTIGYFRIIKEGSVAAGVRRMEAVTGKAAEAYAKGFENQLINLAETLKTPLQTISERVHKLLEENRNLTLQLKQLKKEQLHSLSNDLLSQVESIHGVTSLLVQLSLEGSELKTFADDLASRIPSALLVLATTEEGRCSILIKVSQDLIAKGIKANEIVKKIAPIIDGNGGGKPDMAQAGGKAPEKISMALNEVRQWIKSLF